MQYLNIASLDNFKIWLSFLEAALQEKVFWKYAANLLENTHAEVWFPCKAILLKSYFAVGVLL